MIVSDINVHLDDATSSYTARFVLLLDSFGLREYVRQPTSGSRQLDVFISRADQPDPVVRVDPPLLSDHSLVVASFDAAREQSVHPSSISRRC